MIHPKELERLLADSRDTALNHIEELQYLRTVLRYMSGGFSYEESLQHAHAQIKDNQNYGE